MINIGWLLITSSHIHQKWWRIKRRERVERRGERSDMRDEGEMEREGRRRGGREAKRYVWGRSGEDRLFSEELVWSKTVYKAQ